MHPKPHHPRPQMPRRWYSIPTICCTRLRAHLIRRPSSQTNKKHHVAQHAKPRHWQRRSPTALPSAPSSRSANSSGQCCVHRGSWCRGVCSSATVVPQPLVSGRKLYHLWLAQNPREPQERSHYTSQECWMQMPPPAGLPLVNCNPVTSGRKVERSSSGT